jgi:hypothetical protein
VFACTHGFATLGISCSKRPLYFNSPPGRLLPGLSFESKKARCTHHQSLGCRDSATGLHALDRAGKIVCVTRRAMRLICKLFWELCLAPPDYQ